MTKTIFITGASTGLGRASAQLFAAKGWKVIATMRDPSKETELQTTPNVTVLALDVTDSGQIADAAAKALAMGPVDVLFNNAGYGLAGAFEGATDEQLTRQLDTNLLGVMRVTQAFLPAMRERGQGTIVTTTSIGGLVTFPFNSVYHATKWGLEGWSESLAFELEPFGRGSTAEEIAEAVYEAATDQTDRVRFVAGEDAKANYAMRLENGVEAFRAYIRKGFMGR